MPLLPKAGSYIAPAETALTTYENIEEVDFPEGFDPDTFMPRKIRIKRKSKELR